MANGNRAFIPILQAVDQIANEKKRQEDIKRQEEREEARFTRQKQRDSTRNKIGFAESLLSNPSVTPETKKQASGMLASLLQNQEVDFDDFSPDFLEPERKIEPVMRTPDIVKKFFPNAPDSAPRSVMSLLLNSAVRLSTQGREKNKEKIKIGNQVFNKSDVKNRLNSIKQDANRLFSSGFQTSSGVREGVSLQEVSKILSQIDTVEKAIARGQLTDEEVRVFQNIQPLTSRLGETERKENVQSELNSIRNDNAKLLNILKGLE